MFMQQPTAPRRSFCSATVAYLKHALLVALLISCAAPAGIRYPRLPSPHDGGLYVVFFSLGQADAMLMVYQGRSLLYDAGIDRSYYQASDNVIAQRIKALTGTSHLDYFVLSHYHR